MCQRLESIIPIVSKFRFNQRKFDFRHSCQSCWYSSFALSNPRCPIPICVDSRLGLLLSLYPFSGGWPKSETRKQWLLFYSRSSISLGMGLPIFSNWCPTVSKSMSMSNYLKMEIDISLVSYLNNNTSFWSWPVPGICMVTCLNVACLVGGSIWALSGAVLESPLSPNTATIFFIFLVFLKMVFFLWSMNISW